MPSGVNTIVSLVTQLVIMIRVVLPEEMVGITEAMNSSAIPGRRNANSSRYRRLGEKPRIPSPEVAATMIRHPLLNWMLILFHSFTPGCNQNGSATYESLRSWSCSLASISLFASMATSLSLWNMAYHRIYALTMVDFPTWRDHLLILNRYFRNLRMASSWNG